MALHSAFPEVHRLLPTFSRMAVCLCPSPSAGLCLNVMSSDRSSPISLLSRIAPLVPFPYTVFFVFGEVVPLGYLPMTCEFTFLPRCELQQGRTIVSFLPSCVPSTSNSIWYQSGGHGYLVKEGLNGSPKLQKLSPAKLRMGAEQGQRSEKRGSPPRSRRRSCGRALTTSCLLC